MATSLPVIKHPKTLGRHTRVDIPFSWTLNGDTVDLEGQGFTVRVWITRIDGSVTGPHATTISGTTATYRLDASDLDTASPEVRDFVEIVAVAENDDFTFVSDARAFRVGDWSGADDYTPA